MKLTRATPIKIMDGGKSMGLTETLIRHDQPRKFRISLEKGDYIPPSVPQRDFLPMEEQLLRPEPSKLPSARLTLHSDRTNHIHSSQCQRLKKEKKSNDFLDEIDIYYLNNCLELINKRKSKPKLEVAELVAFIGTVQKMNAARPLSSDFLNKFLSDLVKAANISEHSYFTNSNFTKIVAQIVKFQ